MKILSIKKNCLIVSLYEKKYVERILLRKLYTIIKPRENDQNKMTDTLKRKENSKNLPDSQCTCEKCVPLKVKVKVVYIKFGFDCSFVFYYIIFDLILTLS